MELAKKDQLQAAVDAISPAEALGSPVVAARAQRYRDQWQTELDIRADNQRAAATWQKIQTATTDGTSELVIWHELARFLQRYPSSEDVDDARQLQARLRTTVQDKFADGADYVQELIREGRWIQVFRYIAVLESAAGSAAAKEAVAELQKMAERQKNRIERDYALLGTRKRMFGEEDILEVRRVVTHYLAIYPDDEEARQLLQLAKTKGAERAAKLLRQAKLFQDVKPSLYRDKLNRAYHLDRGGESGQRALAMLNEG